METRNRMMSFALCQYIAADGVREPVHVDTDQEDAASCWGVAGYVECLEHVLEWWEVNGEYRMRRWIETVIVPLG